MIRPTSATATTRFSALYDVSHSISGAGLPENFTPDSPHATYAGNNHWTTAANRTIGESATYFFSTPTPIGGFYIWNHRSNGVASNPYYAVVRFDLVFRDAAQNVLVTFVDITSQPNIEVAQQYAFNVIQNVSSVQFIVRETNNNNSSPYTGLAEVAFDTCIPARAASLPERLACPGATVTLSGAPFGTLPLAGLWQIEAGAPGSEKWIDLADGAMPGAIGGNATVSGAATGELTIVGVDAAAARRYRLSMSNPCGEAAGNAVAVTLCESDFNCDGASNSQDFFDFLAVFFEGDLGADFNGDAVVNSQDFFDFLTAFFAGC